MLWQAWLYSMFWSKNVTSSILLFDASNWYHQSCDILALFGVFYIKASQVLSTYFTSFLAWKWNIIKILEIKFSICASLFTAVLLWFVHCQVLYKFWALLYSINNPDDQVVTRLFLEQCGYYWNMYLIFMSLTNHNCG